MRVMRWVLVAAVAAAIAAWGLVPAGASERVNSFSGSCSIQGTNSFSPPANNTTQALTIDYHGTGTCSGTLNGRNVSNAAVTVHNWGHSSGGCQSATTTSPADGVMTFSNGTTLRYTFTFHFVVTEGVMNFNGQRSGTALGRGTFLTPQTPPDTTQKCAGSGVSSLPLDITMVTNNPLVSSAGGGSGKGQGPGGTPGHATRTSGRLRVAVHPRRVRVGHRTALWFRVVTSDGRPRPGATVVFAGHRARTGRRGRARIVVTFHRRGRRVARVTMAGFQAARLTVAVR